MIYNCASCNRKLATRAEEIPPPLHVPARDRREPTPYVAVIRFPVTIRGEAREEAFFCCADCADGADSPGKYEAQRGRNALGKVLILEALAGNGSEDDYMTSEGWGYCGRFERFLLSEDTSGFVSFEEFPTAKEAEKRFMALYSEGWGYQEDDAVISEDGSVWFGGKQLNVYPPRHTEEISDRRKLAAIRLEMSRSGFYPNVWKFSERGNVSLVEGV